jgi:diguanylate cyclase (GGDEF)-like protein
VPDPLLQALGAALDGLDVAMCAFDDDDRALAWNQTFLICFPEHRGFVHEGEPYADNLHRFYRSRLGADEQHLVPRYVQEGLERHRAQRRPYEFDHRGWRLQVSSAPVGPGGARVRVWRRLRALEPAAKPLPATGERPMDRAVAAVLERMPDGVLVLDMSDRAVWANPALLQMLGLATPQDVQGLDFETLYRACWERAAGEDGAAEAQAGLQVLQQRERFVGTPGELRLPQDQWVRVMQQPGDPVDGRAYIVLVDISAMKQQQGELAEAYKRIENQAVTDSLTGLPNRRRFDGALDSEFRRASRDHLPLSLLVFDIDNFKLLNDNHGHPVGDEALQRIAGVVSGFAQRAGDLVARIGGEEFALLLPTTPLSAAAVIADRLKTQVATCPMPDGVPRVTVSVGVCTLEEHGADITPRVLMRCADDALYAAKRSGRNRVALSNLGHPSGA